jgi:hypothetical protein
MIAKPRQEKASLRISTKTYLQQGLRGEGDKGRSGSGNQQAICKGYFAPKKDAGA